MDKKEKGDMRCTLDSRFKVVDCSISFSQLLGYSISEIIGKKVLADFEVINILQKEGNYRGNVVFLDSSGNSVYADCEIKGDKTYEVLVKEYVKVDSSIRGKIFINDPDPIMILSKNHTILDINNETAKLLGKKREEVIGQKCYFFMHHTTSPAEGCPLVEALNKGKSEAINLMNTVFGNFVINVQEIEEGIFAHYAIKEAAVLLETQNRMISLLERYNRILLTTVEVNTILMDGSEPSEVMEKIVDKLMKIQEFRGILISVGLENGKSTINISRGTVNVQEKRFEKVEWPKSIVIEVEDKQNIVIPIKYGGVVGHLIINTGQTRISDDEMEILRTMTNNIGVYLEAKNLDMKREMSYNYMLEAMNGFAQLVDRIRNPLAVLMATAEVEIDDEELRNKIIDNVNKIQDITKKIDQLWNKSEKLEKMLKEK